MKLKKISHPERSVHMPRNDTLQVLRTSIYYEPYVESIILLSSARVADGCIKNKIDAGL